MEDRRHRYPVQLTWAGSQPGGDRPFKRHDRSYWLNAPGRPPIAGSSDPVFRGDAAKWNPENLLVASLAACHQLWYLGLCAEAGITVVAYDDAAEGVMTEEGAGGAGQFTEVILRPQVTLAPGSDVEAATALHHVAHEKCFIARSVNFPVRHMPSISIAPSE
ncbi:OsmC family protein [Telmatospirillum sp.]|uniref:OsmC family protein n=1 Tax=Telmatospirillum sp. TaxID=2079197 RepID=UPI0028414032|nr:OsmC family protein [Telmatospirillum sp.]MDR3438637.1 OsmC family protein [Telmatospirillum sp.]